MVWSICTQIFRFFLFQNATAIEGALIDLTKVIQKQHEIAEKEKEPCSGIVYVHKREDCVSLAARISKVILRYLFHANDQFYLSFHLDSLFYHFVTDDWISDCSLPCWSQRLWSGRNPAKMDRRHYTYLRCHCCIWNGYWSGSCSLCHTLDDGEISRWLLPGVRLILNCI